MWTRATLKELAKKNFKRAYTQSIIVCIIVYLIGAVFSGGNNAANNSIQTTITNNQYEYYEQQPVYEEDEFINKAESAINFSAQGTIEKFFENIFNGIYNGFAGASIAILIMIIVGFAIVSMVLRAIIYNPIVVGKNNFFMGIREGERKIGDIFFLFDKSKFIKPAITMFFIDLFTFLWTLLLFVPGIIKSYEYKMIPYILAENPDMDRKRAFELSKYMMNGQKWDTFVLDLSFIGWYILSSITFGLVGVFYVNPYLESTYAELYGVLRENALQSNTTNTDELPGFAIEIK